MRWLSLLIGVLALHQAPAHAAIVDAAAEELSCVFAELSQDGLNQIYDSWHDSADRPQQEAMFESVIVPSLTACVERYGWDGEIGPVVALFGIAEAIKFELDRRFPLSVAERAIVEQVIADIPFEEKVTAGRSGQYWVMGRRRSTTMLQSAGISAERASDLNVVGHFDVRLRLAGLAAAFQAAKTGTP